MDLFGTAGIRGSVDDFLTPALALHVGQAAGLDGSEFVVGRDGRETGEALESAVASGLASAGADVRRVGMVPTPALAFASRGRYGMQVTASHNPPTDNGIKLFRDGVEYDREAEERIENRASGDPTTVSWDQWGSMETESVLHRYREAITDYVKNRSFPDGYVPSDRPDSKELLGDIRVVVDCGNGMASLATPDVLGSLGADVVTLNASIDGHFPGRPSKPTPDTLSDLQAFVEDTAGNVEGHVFGIAHDGDADRIVIVDAEGVVVHEDTVLAILAEYYVRTAAVDDPVVVTTPNASGRIDERITAAGGRVERVRLGALHEGTARVKRGEGTVVFAAEPWKHIHPAFGGWIDGIASAALLGVLIGSAGGLEPLREPITERPYRKESLPCPDELKEDAMDELSEALPAAFPDATSRSDYGIRLDFQDGSWVLVRPSGTEPYLRLYVESEDIEDRLETVSGIIRERIDQVSH